MTASTPRTPGLLAIGHPRFVPCTPLGIRELLIANGIETKGAHAVILGRSQIVGKSMALLLLQKGLGGDATVTVCHSASRDVDHFTRQADILIAAIGRAEHVKADAIKPGAVVIDVGMNRRADGSLCGDVDYRGAAEVASWITPVPGGVGPMTVALLLRNTLDAFRRLGASLNPESGSGNRYRVIDRAVRMRRRSRDDRCDDLAAGMVLSIGHYATVLAAAIGPTWSNSRPSWPTPRSRRRGACSSSPGRRGGTGSGGPAVELSADRRIALGIESVALLDEFVDEESRHRKRLR